METIFYNASFTTMDESCPTAEAVLVRDGRFAAVGSYDDVLAQASPEAKRVDLKGAAAYPGMIDSHLHILNLAIMSRELVLTEIRRRADLFAAVAARADKTPADAVIDGRGFNEDLWDDRTLPTRKELDAAAPHHAVRLTRVCGHMVIANSKAIELAGITAQTPVPEGGAMDLEKGIFAENAINLLFAEEGDPGEALCKELLFEGMSMAAKAGLTAIYSDDFYTGNYSMHTVAAAYRALEKEGRMPVRVVQQCALATDALWNEFISSGFRYGQGSDMYRIGPRKLYADGSLGARTAWLTVPYADAPDRQGVPIYAQQELNRLGAQAHAAGMPFIVHAIGDAATESVLNAIDYARRTIPGTDDLPSGIVHCQITSADQLERIAREHVTVYAQPVFTEYDLHICRDRVGEALEKTSYNWATLYRSSACISSGSDCPVEPLDPAINIYCAVTRMDFDRTPEGGWLPEQRLTVQEAISCHTVQAARAAQLDDRLGRIRPGYLADMTVFDTSLERLSPELLKEAKPLLTVVGGIVRPC
ncbi:MAG: amidohydrolase [Clostridia bacterium]|nr:amidohydrolase [Clostridia bacterium]